MIWVRNDSNGSQQHVSILSPKINGWKTNNFLGCIKSFHFPTKPCVFLLTLLAFIWTTHFKSFLFLPSTCFTPPETNIAPENRPFQKKQSYSNHPFSGVFAVSFREGFFDPKVSKSKNFHVPGTYPKRSSTNMRINVPSNSSLSVPHPLFFFTEEQRDEQITAVLNQHRERQGEQWKKGPWLVGLYRGWNTTQLYGDY